MFSRPPFETEKEEEDLLFYFIYLLLWLYEHTQDLDTLCMTFQTIEEHGEISFAPMK